MREIAYQLNRQTGATFDIPEEEQDDIPAENAEEVDFTPPAAYLPTLIAQLPSLKRPVVVVLDAFDLFASHPRQALLYCLLDTVQSCRVGSDRHGLLVVGVSCVVNCVNLLEKRVKSRFSHRILKIANPSTIEEYIEAARRMMNVGLGKEDLPQENKARHKEFKECCAAAVEVFTYSLIGNRLQHSH
jgi:origin recognition complex subunit 4